VESGKTAAKLTDGVLTITLAKTEASKPRRVEIRAEL
jgi:HSP20 family molecular chaperone IbpA